jgi:hyperosmotically inducible protein
MEYSGAGKRLPDFFGRSQHTFPYKPLARQLRFYKQEGSEMKSRILEMAMLAVALLTGTASAADKAAILPQGDAAVAASVRHAILMYPYYSIWDDVSFRVSNGQVELSGAVTQPYKKSDIEHLVQKVPDVTSVTDQIKVLPLSDFDDRLRLQVARAIYGDPVFTQYRNLALPPIHIIVENGKVTLTGVVNNDLEKQVAGMRANGAGLGFGNVVNNLLVEHPAAKKS